MEITLKIDGMMCSGCEKRVRNALMALSGVTAARHGARVSHEKGTAVVTTDGTVEKSALETAVLNQGYDIVG